METVLLNAIQELSTRMRLLKVMQEDKSSINDLSDREIMILGLLSHHSEMSVSQIAAADPTASESTISTTITKLWRDKKMVSKNISPESQRVTIVTLTDHGKEALDTVMQQRSDRFKALIKALKVTEHERDVLIDVCTRSVKFMDSHFGQSADK